MSSLKCDQDLNVSFSISSCYLQQFDLTRGLYSFKKKCSLILQLWLSLTVSICLLPGISFSVGTGNVHIPKKWCKIWTFPEGSASILELQAPVLLPSSKPVTWRWNAKEIVVQPQGESTVNYTHLPTYIPIRGRRLQASKFLTLSTLLGSFLDLKPKSTHLLTVWWGGIISVWGFTV